MDEIKFKDICSESFTFTSSNEFFINQLRDAYNTLGNLMLSPKLHKAQRTAASKIMSFRLWLIGLESRVMAETEKEKAAGNTTQE